MLSSVVFSFPQYILRIGFLRFLIQTKTLHLFCHFLEMHARNLSGELGQMRHFRDHTETASSIQNYEKLSDSQRTSPNPSSFWENFLQDSSFLHSCLQDSFQVFCALLSHLKHVQIFYRFFSNPGRCVEPFLERRIRKVFSCPGTWPRPGLSSPESPPGARSSHPA